MFETEELSQTEPIPIQFASAENGEGANDTFTLKNVPTGQTVKVYTKSGTEYTKIGEAVAEDSTVTITGLDFGTADAGRIYYTTTAIASRESIKMAARFEAEGVEKTPALTSEDIEFNAFSQPGSVSSSNADDIFISLTVKNLQEGDVVYVYDAVPLTRAAAADNYTKVSLPVAAGESSVTISGIRVPRAGSLLTMQVKRDGMLLSDKFTVETPAFEDPVANIQLNVTNVQGEPLTGVSYDIYNGEDKVGTLTDTTPAEVKTGALYTLKCTAAPEDYQIGEDTLVLVTREGETYTVNITLKSVGGDPVVTGVTVTPATAMVEKGQTKNFTRAGDRREPHRYHGDLERGGRCR